MYGSSPCCCCLLPDSECASPGSRGCQLSMPPTAPPSPSRVNFLLICLDLAIPILLRTGHLAGICTKTKKDKRRPFVFPLLYCTDCTTVLFLELDGRRDWKPPYFLGLLLDFLVFDNIPPPCCQSPSIFPSANCVLRLRSG